jgi:hypothetical protein
MELAIFALLMVPWGLHRGYYGRPPAPAEPALRPGFVTAVTVMLGGLLAVIVIAVLVNSHDPDLGEVAGEILLLELAVMAVVIAVPFGLGLAVGRRLRGYHPPTRPSPVRVTLAPGLPAVTVREVIFGRADSRVGDTGGRRARDRADPTAELIELLAERAAADRERAAAGSR